MPTLASAGNGKRTTVLAASYDTAGVGDDKKPKITAMNRDLRDGSRRHTLRANSKMAS